MMDIKQIQQHAKKILIKNFLKIINFENELIQPEWYFQVKLKCLFSNKFKIGFGPITTGEDDLAERKWRIDPIINKINSLKNCGYVSGFFIHPEEMKQFDMIVIVKKFTREYIDVVRQLKRDRKLFIYDIVDNPNAEQKYSIYFADCPEFSKLMDGFILSSPLHEAATKKFLKPSLLIEHPIINPLYKMAYSQNDVVNIIAHGYYENIKNIKVLEPIIKEISSELDKKIILTYHSEVVFNDTEWVKYIKWNVKNCFAQLLDADMAIVIKKLYLRHQRSKPSTKAITFMAAGLPVICTPTMADRLVMQHRVNGLFAYTLDDWRYYIKLLASRPLYRKQIAKSARNHVLSQYTISKITDQYIQLFDSVRQSVKGTRACP